MKNMKVLMFGWEFPPKIYGGLAVASYGITKGLSLQGDVETTFCMPKPTGQEEKFLKIVNMSQVPVVWRDVWYDNIKDRFVGQRVSVETHIWDGTCPHCLAGNRHICANMSLFGIMQDGAFAEYAKIRADCSYVLDDAISDEQGCIYEPMGSGVHGVEEAEVKGKTVLVAGCGAIGLTVVAACHVFGARRIIACDLFDEKLEAARAMGADIVINSSRENLTERVLGLTDGLGVEAAIDVTGSPTSLNSSLKSVMAGGRLVSVGLPGEPVTMNMTEDLFYRQIRLSGICGRKIWSTWEHFTEVMKDPIYDMSRVIGGQFALEDFEKGFAAMRSGVPGKMFLYP